MRSLIIVPLTMLWVLSCSNASMTQDGIQYNLSEYSYNFCIRTREELFRAYRLNNEALKEEARNDFKLWFRPLRDLEDERIYSFCGWVVVTWAELHNSGFSSGKLRYPLRQIKPSGWGQVAEISNKYPIKIWWLILRVPTPTQTIVLLIGLLILLHLIFRARKLWKTKLDRWWIWKPKPKKP